MRIGFVGLGTMGTHMAAHLQRAGHKLAVHDMRHAAAQPHIAAGAEWAATPRANGRLELALVDNYNPVCNLTLPLPVAGRWAPAWVQTHGTPEIRVQLPAHADSLHWAVRDDLGHELARGTAAGGSLWRPALGAVPPGTYVLSLRQGRTVAAHPLLIVGRPAGSAPDTEWRKSALPPAVE